MIKKNILCTICARKGSKGLKNKKEKRKSEARRMTAPGRALAVCLERGRGIPRIAHLLE